MFYFLLIILALFFLWPYIRRWIYRYAQRKMEDRMRQAFGFPPREEEPKSQRGQQRRQKKRNPFAKKEKIIPNEYGEDVEYVEIKEFDQTEIHADNEDGIHVKQTHKKTVIEGQVSDAEWEEVK